MTTPDTRSSGRSTTASKTDGPPETPTPGRTGVRHQGNASQRSPKPDVAQVKGARQVRVDEPAAAPKETVNARSTDDPPAAPGYFARRHRSVPAIAALLTLLAGILDILSALTPSIRSRARDVNDVLPGALSHSATALTLVFGMLLVLLARALYRRKRRAWRATVFLLAASTVSHVAKGLDVEEAIVAFLLLLTLVLYRRDFYAKGDPTTRWRAVWYGAALISGSIVLGMILLQLRVHRMVGPHPLSAQFEHVLRGLVGFDGPLKFRPEGVDDLVARVLGGMGLLTALAIAYLALRPPEPRAMLTRDDETRMRALLEGPHGGRDSLGYFALRRDKSVVWSPSGKAAIAYRVLSGVLLASGDPLGDPEAWPGAIKEFMKLADEHAWTPAVIGCSEAGGTAFARVAGMSALEFGDEAVVELCDFSLDGRAMRNVRQACGRPERAGYTVRVCRSEEITAEDRIQLREQAAAWRGSETERGFSMALGRFGDPADGRCAAVMAFDADNKLRGFLHFVPWGEDGLSLDLMRRDRDAENGINEFLIVAALREATRLGVTKVSLNFAVFRSALERGERLGAGPILKAWRGVLVFASRWFQIDSLYRFNAKFRPIWEPRFVCYPNGRDLPRIAIAMLEAEAFIVWPRPHLRRTASAVHPSSAQVP
jgi:lysyl-tRNA synthetase, class II